MSYQLDPVDIRILRELQRNNQLTNLQLAELVNVSPPTCRRRVQELRRLGIIKADVSLVNPDKIGSYLEAIVAVKLRTEDMEEMRKFELSLTSFPCVMQCHLVLGEMDYMLFVQTADMRAYEDFAKRALYESRMVDKFTTVTIMRTVISRTSLDPAIHFSGGRFIGR